MLDGWSSSENVKRDILRRGGSEATIRNYRVMLGYFCGWLDLTPDEAVEGVRSGKIDCVKVLQDWVC